MYVCDIEADGLLGDAKRIHVLVARKDKDTALVFHDTPGIPRDGELRDGIALLSREPHTFHNGLGYDWPLLERLGYGALFRNFRETPDTLLLSRFLFPQRMAHSIESWGRGFGVEKPAHSDWSELSDEMVYRCIQDTLIGLRVWETMRDEMASRDGGMDAMALALDTEHRFQWEFRVSHYVGHPIDVDGGRRLLEQLEGEMEGLEQRIVSNFPPRVVVLESMDKTTGCYRWQKPVTKAGILSVNAVKYWEPVVGTGAPYTLGDIVGPVCRVDFRRLELSSDKQVKGALLRLGWKPTEWNYTGDPPKRSSPKLTEDSYDSLPPGIGADIAAWKKRQHRFNSIRGYLERTREVGGTHRMMWGIKGVGTQAHRAAHEGLVNIPAAKSFLGKEVRSLFVPPPGKVMVGTDLEGAHLHLCGVWAQVWDGGEYINAMLSGDKEAGTDNHSLLAKSVGISRDDAKTLIYLKINGGGPGRLASELGWKVSKAKEVLRDMAMNFPIFDRLSQAATNQWRQLGYVKTRDGRRLYPRKETECLSYLMLATETQIMKRGFLIALEWARQSGMDVEPLSMNHDEVQVAMSPEHTDRWAVFMREAVAHASRESGITPEVRTETKVGINWYETH